MNAQIADAADIEYRYTNQDQGPRLKRAVATVPDSSAAARSTYFYDDLGSVVKIQGQQSNPGGGYDPADPPGADVCDQAPGPSTMVLTTKHSLTAAARQWFGRR